MHHNGTADWGRALMVRSSLGSWPQSPCYASFSFPVQINGYIRPFLLPGLHYQLNLFRWQLLRHPSLSPVSRSINSVGYLNLLTLNEAIHFFLSHRHTAVIAWPGAWCFYGLSISLLPPLCLKHWEVTSVVWADELNQGQAVCLPE